MMDEQRLQQGRLQQGQTRGNGPGAVPAPGVGGQGRDRGRGGVGARSESERKPPLGPGTRVRATGRGCPAQRPRLLGFPAGRAGNTPLQCQATVLHRECHAHLPRPRQHPAGVLLARAYALTGDARCWLAQGGGRQHVPSQPPASTTRRPPELAGTTSKRHALPVVRDEEARIPGRAPNPRGAGREEGPA